MAAPLSRRALLKLTAAAPLAAAVPAVLAQSEGLSALERLRQRGSVIIGVYNDMPPFNLDGKGIDVDLADALAKALGLKLSLLPFNAGEDMNDDLRNMVWKGHYLGFGPADVLLHVPVDRPLMENNPKVKILAPYYRERVMIARDVTLVPQMDSLDAFKGRMIAVPGQSLAGWLLIGSDGGRYREQLQTKLKDGVEAARLLKNGNVAAAAGHASELESVLGGDPRFVIDPLPLPRMREGWAVGCAVKTESVDLAQAVQQAINTLGETGELARIFARGKVSWKKA